MKLLTGIMITLLVLLGATSEGETSARTKVAEGEYAISSPEDLGVGPLETEVFHFHETWELWWSADGFYQLEGSRTFESPKDEPREEDFQAILSSKFELQEIVLRSHLRFVRDSGPFLTCTGNASEFVCDSGGKDPVHTRHIRLDESGPYAIIWPISVFSMGHVAFLASEQEVKPLKIGLIQIKEINPVLPIMTIQSSGTIQYLGRSQVAYAISGTSWLPRVFRLASETTRNLYIWTSTEGIVLAIQSQSPEVTIQLIRFTQFAPFQAR